MSEDVPRLVDHLFRREAGRMIASLTRIFGAHNLDLAEECVQDALVRALQQWPFHGVPANPRAWLIQTAKHRALDRVRRRAMHDRNAPAIAARLAESQPMEPAVPDALSEDQLCMMFMCCHPALQPAAQIALMLSVVCGFSAREVARAFLLDEAAAAQRLVRAKRRLREVGAVFELPSPPEAGDRLSAVLACIYLLFNEGYAPGSGDAAVRGELCGEALRLARLLVEHPHTRRPATHALFSLLCFQAARLGTRADDAGDLLLLDEQDRSQWDRSLIAAGFVHLDHAAAGDVITPWHVQAAIASCHAAAPSFDDTDWTLVLRLYDDLMQVQPSPVVALNRAVACCMVHGAAAALPAALALADEPALQRYLPLPATIAELYRRAGDAPESLAWLERALRLDCTPAERRLLEKRRAALHAPPAA